MKNHVKYFVFRVRDGSEGWIFRLILRWDTKFANMKLMQFLFKLNLFERYETIKPNEESF